MALAGSTEAQTTQPIGSSGPLRVLFVGNSLTYVNDLPGTLQRLAQAAGHELTVGRAVHGGYSFHKHWDQRTFDPALKEGKWDLVVLQGQSAEESFPAERRKRESDPYVEDLAKLFREHGAKCVLFETWGTRDGNRHDVPDDTYTAMQSRIREGYRDTGRLISAPVVPVGDAWELAMKQKPSLQLWVKDGKHPEPAGTYMASCVFYEFLYHQSPVGLKYSAKLDPQTAEFLQHAADETIKNSRQPATSPAENDVKADRPEPRVFTDSNGEKLPYLLLKPAGYDPAKRYPLVLFYHGAGERGDDNHAQWKNGVSVFARPENRKKYPCFVIAPQCPRDKQWVNVPWSAPAETQPAEPSDELKLSLEILDQVRKEFSIDPDRLYVCGLSMGGFATWDVIARRPDLFACAVPVCGGGDERTAPKIKRIPIWAFHGGADTTVKTSRSRNMIAAIKEAGGNPKYTEYPGVGHNSWDKAFNDPELLEWMFAQKRTP